MSDTKTNPPEFFKRFTLFRQVEHHLNAIVFSLLVLTGLAQRFHEASWAQGSVRLMGGIDNVHVYHRIAGIVFVVIFTVHLVGGIMAVLSGKRLTMFIVGNDFRDAIQNMNYFMGRVDKPARCDRFEYKQKFEYWGVIMGSLVMGITGLLLLFPTWLFSTFPFIPGQALAAAKAAHSNEALMAFLVIVTWHIYDAVLSPEVFPLDTTIFTGKISRARMMHEHPLEYERITGLPAESHDHGHDDEHHDDSHDKKENA